MIAELDIEAKADAVKRFWEAVRSGETAISYLPVALFDLLDTDSWREFDLGWGVERPATFREFVEDHLKIRPAKTVSDLLDKHPDPTIRNRGVRLFNEALEGALAPHGDAARIVPGLAQPDIVRLGEPGYGNSRAHGLARLARDRPDLLERVEAGEMSTNAACLEAGWRRKKVQVPVEDMEALAKVLRRHLSEEQVRELGSLLI